MKLSIIIPTYNAEEYVVELVEQVCRQMHADDELIVVDDASTDQTVKRASEHIDSNLNYTIIRKECNSGVSNSRNVGLRQATGDYIIFFDFA